MKKIIKNSVSGRIACVLFIFIVLLFQIYMYPLLRKQYTFLNTQKVAKAKVLEISERKLVLSFKDEIGNNIIKERLIDDYNPFTKLVKGNILTIKYSTKLSDEIIVEGYDEEALTIIIILLFILPLIAQIIFLLVIFNRIDEKNINFSKR